MTTLAQGAQFAGYRIEELAGGGGMGRVYRARQQRPDRLVALKVISPDIAQDGEFRQRFQRESEIAAAIEHPHVIPVYEVGEENGLPFIVMRYVGGNDLRRIAEGGLDPAEAVNLVDQVAGALDAAH